MVLSFLKCRFLGNLDSDSPAKETDQGDINTKAKEQENQENPFSDDEEAEFEKEL